MAVFIDLGGANLFIGVHYGDFLGFDALLDLPNILEVLFEGALELIFLLEALGFPVVHLALIVVDVAQVFLALFLEDTVEFCCFELIATLR